MASSTPTTALARRAPLAREGTIRGIDNINPCRRAPRNRRRCSQTGCDSYQDGTQGLKDRQSEALDQLGRLKPASMTPCTQRTQPGDQPIRLTSGAMNEQPTTQEPRCIADYALNTLRERVRQVAADTKTLRFAAQYRYQFKVGVDTDQEISLRRYPPTASGQMIPSASFARIMDPSAHRIVEPSRLEAWTLLPDDTALHRLVTLEWTSNRTCVARVEDRGGLLVLSELCDLVLEPLFTPPSS